MDAWQGNKGGLLVAFSADNGNTLAEYNLEYPPVFDGMAAANGRLYLSLKNGKVLCFGADNYPPIVDT
jgi:outer membrane protein assembly factor BamB